MKKIRVVELYAGTARSIEPFRRWKRTEIALLVDANKFARDTYLRNFPDARYACRDLAKLRPSELAQLADGEIDVVLGCPPCQGFSESGSRRDDDPRNRHMRHFARLATAVRPRVIVMENVPGVGDSEEFEDLTDRLSESGYSWSSIVANAAQYGSCQSRQRLLLVAFREDLGGLPVFPLPTHGGKQPIFSYSLLKLRELREDPIDMLGVTP